MANQIEVGQMAFLADGKKAVGAVRSVFSGTLVIYVENAGDFNVPLSAVSGTHSQKVILDTRALDKALLKAIGHAHERESPDS